MNGYGLMVLFGPDEAKEAKISKITKIVEDAEGKVEKVDDWGIRDLAYPIKKFSKAHYLFFTCFVPSKELISLDKAVRIQEDIIRYLLVRKESGRIKEPKSELVKESKKENTISKKQEEKSEPPVPAKPDSASQKKKVETKKTSKVKKAKKVSSAKGSGGLKKETKEGKNK